MTKITKARKYTSSILQELLEEVTPLEMKQTETKMQIAVRIGNYMKAKGWNKTTFADKAEKNRSEITKWLSGTQNLTVDILTEIAFTLNVEITDLLGKEQVIYRTNIIVTSTVSPMKNPFTTLYSLGAKICDTHSYVGQGVNSFNNQEYKA